MKLSLLILSLTFLTAPLGATPSWLTQSFERTLTFEGFRSCPYPDPPGSKVTYSRGYGEYLGPLSNPSSKALCVSQGAARKKAWLTYNTKLKRLRGRLVRFDSYPIEVRMVLIDMAYNLGVVGLMRWTETLDLIDQGYYSEAGDRITQSLYARQVKDRALSNIQLLEKVNDRVRNNR